MSIFFKFLVATFLCVPAFACKGGNESSLQLRGSEAGLLTKYPNGKALVSITPFYAPSAIQVAVSIKGREKILRVIQREWDISREAYQIGIDANELENSREYFKIDTVFHANRRKAGTFRITGEELFRIARSSGCGGVIKGY